MQYKTIFDLNYYVSLLSITILSQPRHHKAPIKATSIIPRSMFTSKFFELEPLVCKLAEAESVLLAVPVVASEGAATTVTAVTVLTPPFERVVL